MIVGDAQQRMRFSLAILAGLVCITSSAGAQPEESSDPIGGITFNPPRSATIRLKGRGTIHGKLIAISAELLHLQIPNGRQFQYELKRITRVQTHDKEFLYVATADTYEELVERARELQGVTIADSLSTVDGTPIVPMPRPEPPPLPRMVQQPEPLRLDEQSQTTEEVTTAGVAPAIPAPQTPAPAAGNGSAQPFLETDTFKIGFLVACIGVIVIWWRNRVG